MTARKKANAPEINHHAILKRFEQLIDVLRTRYVCEGWQLDEEGAARTLRYFRRCADNSGRRQRITPEFHAALEFLHHHGQSIDWVMTGDETVMICCAAASSSQAPIALARRVKLGFAGCKVVRTTAAILPFKPVENGN
jgi:hypothetical protein